MKGLMGGEALTVRALFDRMSSIHADAEIVSAVGPAAGGPRTTRLTYGEVSQRVRRWVTLLRELGVGPGDRVGSFANNSHHHVELYYAVPLAGAVLHTVNIRLHPDQIAYVVDHAGDSVLLVDDDLAERLDAVRAQVPGVRHVLTMSEAEERLTRCEPADELPELAEDAACVMCHTSGTTGLPKAVVYSHRSMYLHAMASCMVDHLALSQHDVVLPVVPLFHACGWGLPYIAPFTGADLVLAGADTSSEHLASLIAQERVTWAAGVPTIWNAMLPLARSGSVDLSSLRTIGVGGAATPRALLEGYDELGIEVLQIWGMTETGPVACTSRPRRRHRGLDATALQDVRLKTGTILAGLEARVVGDDGQVLPWDGTSVGELECRGPWVATGYYEDPSLDDRFHDGWLRTGDVAVMEPDGMFTIVDRSKDLVKSGGEWISSVELEGLLLSHPLVRECAVVGVRSERWEERPVVVVAPVNGVAPTLDEVHAHLAPHVAKWWLPDDVVVVEEVPKTSVGKLDKKVLRAMLADRVLP